MENMQNRHDVSDEQWMRIEPIIKTRLGNWGGSNANDNRVFVNACLWIVRTGAPWRDLPPQYGKYNAVHRRYKRWCDENHWDYILAELIDDPDFEWLMMMHPIARCIRAHLERLVETKRWSAQKGAQHQNSPCGGCEWFASQNHCHRRYKSRLQTCSRTNRRDIGGIFICGQRIRHQRNHRIRKEYGDGSCYSSEKESS